MRAAIVGAGVAGLVLARRLEEQGHQVRLFEKGRRVGGRLATRNEEQGAFDHGAQRFSARGPLFAAEVERWAERGLIAPSEPAGAGPWWLPAPSATRLAEALATGLAVRTSARVTGLRRSGGAWHLNVAGAVPENPFDVVLVTAPAPQSAELLLRHGAFGAQLERVRYDPTWALLLGCDALGITLPEEVFTEGARGEEIALFVREGKKPGRVPDGSLVRLLVHASSAFSVAHLEATQESVVTGLLAALRARPGLHALRPRFAHAYRWRHARVTAALGVPMLFDRERGLGVAGDGMLGPRLEAAFESGRALAEAVLAR